MASSANADATGPSQGPKRSHSGSEESVNVIEPSKRLRQEAADTWYRFLIISSDNEEKIKASPFAVQKTIQVRAGTPKMVKHLRSGDILVETHSSKQSRDIEAINKILEHPVKVRPHRSLNYSKVVIFCPELRGESDSSILNELSDQEVCEVKKLGRAGTVLLTFAKPDPPEYVNVGFIRCKCNTYVPNPIRCSHCQKLGHVSSNCNGKPSCAKCGQEGHNNTECSANAICVNCAGPHEASDKTCPAWIKEKNVMKIKITQKVSIPQARRIYEQNSAPMATYAHVSSPKPVKPQTADMGTQTDPTLALYLIKELLKTDEFRNAVAEIIADTSADNVPPKALVPVPNVVDVQKAADSSASHEKNESASTVSVCANPQNKSSFCDQNQTKPRGHTMAVSAANRVSTSQQRPISHPSLSHSRDLRQTINKSRNKQSVNLAQNGRKSGV